MIKEFEIKCPWCQSTNFRKTLYWTYPCFKCKKLFYVNRNLKACRVIKEGFKWKHLDEDKQSWMN